MKFISAANAVLAFAIEIAMLVAFGYWGFHNLSSTTGKIVLGVGVPVAIIIIWAIWAAPKSGRRLKQPKLLALKLALFFLAAVVLLAANQPVLAGIFLVLALINQIVEYRFGGKHAA